jgi:hypothetical protein
MVAAKPCWNACTDTVQIEDETPEVRPATAPWIPKLKNRDQLAVEETHTWEESREDSAECMDLMSSGVESAPNVPPLNTASINYGDYSAMIAGTEFSACSGLLGFNGSTYEGQPRYGKDP